MQPRLVNSDGLHENISVFVHTQGLFMRLASFKCFFIRLFCRYLIVVPRTLYFTDTSNRISSQAWICSLRHTFQLSAHIHPVSLVLPFLFFHEAGSTCHFIRFVFSSLGSLSSLKWLNSLPAFPPSHTNCLSPRFLSPKTFGHRKKRG